MKAIRNVSIPLFILFVPGAGDAPRLFDRPAIRRTDVPSTASRMPAKPERAKMWTRNAVLYKSDTLELHFATPNAPYLGVTDPQGHFFYLVFPIESTVGELTPLVESERFISLQTLRISTASLKADPYTYGVYANQPVFTRSGTYTFVTGENLHVDDPSLLSKVVVRYVHTRPPVHASKEVTMNQINAENDKK